MPDDGVSHPGLGALEVWDVLDAGRLGCCSKQQLKKKTQEHERPNICPWALGTHSDHQVQVVR
jgi:hypothetical protein